MPWITKATVKVDGWTVEFRALYEDMRDQMCDALKPQYEATQYEVLFREDIEGTAAAPIMALTTNKQYGNRLYREVSRCTDPGQVYNIILRTAFYTKVCGRNFQQLWPGKFSGYFNGYIGHRNIPNVSDVWDYISATPVLAAQL